VAKSATGDGPADHGRDDTEPRWWRLLRRVLAALLLVGLLAIAASSSLAERPRVCEEQLAQVGTQPIARSCRPVQATDPPFILGVLVILALVLPDFSKIEILGFLSLQRRLQEQEERQTGLETQLQNLNLRILQQVSQRTNVYNFVGPHEDLSRFEERLDEKAQEFLNEPNR
jgi:hypothetical protein